MYQLRIYTLRTAEALDDYATRLAPPHSEPARLWCHHPRDLDRTHAAAHRLLALISYPDGADLAVVNAAYMASPGFAADMDGFDVGNIVNVEELLLEPTTASPLA